MKNIIKFKNIPLSILLVILLSVYACNNSKNSKDTSVTISKPDTLSDENKTSESKIKSDTLTSIFKSIKLNEIKKIKTQSTSTLLPKKRTTYYSLPTLDKEGFCGLYFFVNRKHPSKEIPFTAKVIIYGQEQPWTFSDSTETLIDLMVYTSEIEISPFLRVGNPIDSVLSVLGAPISELKKDGNDILFYNQNETVLSIKVKDHKIQVVKMGRYATSKYSFEEIKNNIMESF